MAENGGEKYYVPSSKDPSPVLRFVSNTLRKAFPGNYMQRLTPEIEREQRKLRRAELKRKLLGTQKKNREGLPGSTKEVRLDEIRKEIKDIQPDSK